MEGQMPQRFGFSAVVVAIVLAVVALGACGGSEEPPATSAEAAASDTATTLATDADTATDAAASDDAITVDIHEENASGQTGTATFTPKAPGVDVAIQVSNDEGVRQFALISEGTCDDLGAPFAGVEHEGPAFPVGAKDGIWPEQQAKAMLGRDTPTLDDLQSGAHAVVVVDVSYRGGNNVEIPPDVRFYQPPDAQGPFGEGYPLAACGDIPQTAADTGDAATTEDSESSDFARASGYTRGRA